MVAPLIGATFGATAFTVFALGLRHGADPDHLAAIDNVTRNGVSVGARASRFAGTLFAGGHSIMVLTIAGIIGLLGSRFSAHGALVESVGTWVSIVTLFAIAALNARQLTTGAHTRSGGIKAALIPRVLRMATNPLAAIPIGLLFGLGFDTSSQIATYALAFTVGGGLVASMVIGLVFSFGMAVTDTLDSLLVYKLCARAPLEAVRATRVWVIAVTGLALSVGGYELAQMLGWRSPLPDIAVSGMLIAALLVAFCITYRSIRVDEGARGRSQFGRRVAAPATQEGGNAMTTAARVAAGAAAIAALVGACFIYVGRPASGSDHQDSFTVINRPGADITDVFVYQAPDNPNDVVLQIDVFPLIPHAALGSDALDPAVLYQFKIDTNGDGTEDKVLQLKPATSGVTQAIDVYGPSRPAMTGTSSTIVAKAGTVAFNDRSGVPLSNGIKVFVGGAKDPFFFDLARFFQILPDRNYQNQPNPAPPDPSIGFAGFAVGNPNGCATTASQDFLSSNQFNVIAIVAEMPKSMLGGGKIGVWATASTTSGK